MIISIPVHVVLIPQTIFIYSYRTEDMAGYVNTWFETGLHRMTKGGNLGGLPSRGLTAGIHHHRPPDFSCHLTRHISGAVKGSHVNLGKPSTFSI